MTELPGGIRTEWWPQRRLGEPRYPAPPRPLVRTGTFEIAEEEGWELLGDFAQAIRRSFIQLYLQLGSAPPRPDRPTTRRPLEEICFRQPLGRRAEWIDTYANREALTFRTPARSGPAAPYRDIVEGKWDDVLSEQLEEASKMPRPTYDYGQITIEDFVRRFDLRDKEAP